jgi:hypothetical protein
MNNEQTPDYGEPWKAALAIALAKLQPFIK